MRGSEKVGKGGIVFCMDNSGSMAGLPEMWSKAVGLATLAIAKEQKRSFYGIHFGSAWELECFDFRRVEDMTLDRVLDFAEFFFGGGTDFMVPLTKAHSILLEEEADKGFIEGDIVFVTDGICAVRNDWLEHFQDEKARLGFRTWGILIGTTPRAPLTDICDTVVTLRDMVGPEPVRQMFRQM
jgi:uncharacterized protein with von Willebrand factor type A (vWA) domain